MGRYPARCYPQYARSFPTPCPGLRFMCLQFWGNMQQDQRLYNCLRSRSSWSIPGTQQPPDTRIRPYNPPHKMLEIQGDSTNMCKTIQNISQDTNRRVKLNQKCHKTSKRDRVRRPEDEDSINETSQGRAISKFAVISLSEIDQ